MAGEPQVTLPLSEFQQVVEGDATTATVELDLSTTTDDTAASTTPTQPHDAYPSGDHTVYVLRLEDGHYYVGQTENNCWDRIRNHFNGGGAAWTEEHPPVDIVEVISGVDDTVEKAVTLDYMEAYGWERVRGAGWTRVDLPSRPSELDAD